MMDCDHRINVERIEVNGVHVSSQGVAQFQDYALPRIFQSLGNSDLQGHSVDSTRIGLGCQLADFHRLRLSLNRLYALSYDAVPGTLPRKRELHPDVLRHEALLDDL